MPFTNRIPGPGLPCPPRNRRAIALVVVLIAAACMLAFFASFQFFSRTEYRHLERILTNTSLDYLVRAGINIAEDKLQKERWYGDSHSRGSFEVPAEFLPPNAKITIFADDYYATAPKKIGSFKYQMLDHVKVYVQASIRDATMYGFGKFIMSPEPTAFGKSTEGVDMSFQTTNASTHTFRKMIHVKLLREADLEDIPGFTRLDDLNSRKALSAHIRNEMHLQAKNFARNLLLSQKITQELASTQPTYSVANLKTLLSNLAGTSAGGYTDNQLKNHFILENMKNFFMTTNWDIPETEKRAELQKVRIEIGLFPPDELTSDSRAAIKEVFGGVHPLTARDGEHYFREITATPNGSAFAEFLKKRGILAPPDESPQELQEELSRSVTDYDYSFDWRATNLWVEYPHVSDTHTTSVCTGGATGFMLYLNLGSDHYATGGGCVSTNKVGPIPRYTNYYMRKDSIYMPLALVFNIFMKYVDESYTYIPDSLVKDEGNLKIPIPDDPISGGGGGWGGVSG